VIDQPDAECEYLRQLRRKLARAIHSLLNLAREQIKIVCRNFKDSGGTYVPPFFYKVEYMDKKELKQLKELDPRHEKLKPSPDKKKRFKKIRSIINQNAKPNKPS